MLIIIYKIYKKIKICVIIILRRANVAQLFRALPCQGRGRELESLHSHHFCALLFVYLFIFNSGFLTLDNFAPFSIKALIFIAASASSSAVYFSLPRIKSP